MLHTDMAVDVRSLCGLQTKVSSIGYPLPSPLVGSPLSQIPIAPWEPFSVCTANNCEANSAVRSDIITIMIILLYLIALS